MTDLIHQQIRELSAYQTVPFDGPIKLDAMECPYGIPASLHVELQAQLEDVEVNRYPDARASELKRQLRNTFDIPATYELTLGNGSDELLQLIQLAVGGYGRTILAPQPSFSMYEIIARYTRAQFVGIDLEANCQLNEQRWLEALEVHQPSCVFFAHPNNPTGNFFDATLIEKTASRTAGLVVSDEAYFAYSGRSMLSSMERHDNLAVVRTLSKSGLAGVRLGYLVSHPQWAAEFEKLRLPYNVGALNQTCASFALKHWDEISQSIGRVLAERQRLRTALSALNGLQVFPSETNFIMVRVIEKDAAQVFEDLRQRGLLIRKLAGMHPMLEQCLRISIGVPHENDVLVSVLHEVLAA